MRRARLRGLIVFLSTAVGCGIIAACASDSDSAGATALDGGVDAPLGADGMVPDGTIPDGESPAQEAGTDAGLVVPSSPLSSFDNFTCLQTDAGVKCWGFGAQGQLGDGTRTTSAVPRTVAAAGLSDPAVGAAAACARVDGGAACWGRSAYGELGYDPILDEDGGTACSGGGCASPRVVEGLSGVDQLSAGFLYACARLASGQVACWGLNDTGQIGVPPTDGGPPQCSGYSCVVTPTTVTNVVDTVQVALASGVTCALRHDGTIWCWGANYTGALGFASADAGPDAAPVDMDAHPPSQVPGIADAVFLALGPGGHACVVHADRTVSCWGRGGYGQTGRPPSEDLSCPYGNKCSVEMKKVAGLADVRELALGARHSCALTTSGSVLCWGVNSDGQLGHDPALDDEGEGDEPYSPTPMAVSLPPAAHIAAGTSHTCALLEDGSVRCWGSNESGELGADAGASSYLPAVVSGL